MKLQNIRLETKSQQIHAELRDDDGSLIICATLDYILARAAERGYIIDGVAKNPLFTRYGT